VLGELRFFLGRPSLFIGLTGAASALSFFAMDSRAFMPDELFAQGVFDHARMHTLDQLTG
jgi:hypothetical protein